jgi:hypothetical protein
LLDDRAPLCADQNLGKRAPKPSHLNWLGGSNVIQQFGYRLMQLCRLALHQRPAHAEDGGSFARGRGVKKRSRRADLVLAWHFCLITSNMGRDSACRTWSKP